MPYDRYPAVDEDYQFPPEVRGALALSPELRNTVVPLTQTQRNNLTGDQLWDGRLVLNKTTNRIDRYDASGAEWIPMTSEPAGIVKEYGGSVAPDFHVLADGSVYPRDGIYAALFSVYGTTYNTGGELSTQFRVPNRRGKTAVMIDPGQPEFNALGKTGGAKTHTLTEAEMPSHAHQADHDHPAVTTSSSGLHNHVTPIGLVGVAAGIDHSVRSEYGEPGTQTSDQGNHDHVADVPPADFDTTTTGSGQAHNNLQPYIVMNYIITL